jgi:hypothetical protein
LPSASSSCRGLTHGAFVARGALHEALGGEAEE